MAGTKLRSLAEYPDPNGPERELLLCRAEAVNSLLNTLGFATPDLRVTAMILALADALQQGADLLDSAEARQNGRLS